MPLRETESDGSFGPRFYLARPAGADVRLKPYPTLSAWLVEIESEVIEVSGCACDGKVLRQGRFYFQTDLLAGEKILRKRPEFLDWADKVFRIAKRSLRRDARLDAYVGEDAEIFGQDGGAFRQSPG